MTAPSAPPPQATTNTAARAVPAVRLSALRKEFGGTPPVVAVDGVDLEIGAGEFFSMLGPSGSGKTTVLRMIAGFEEPTSGRVELGGVDVTRRQPYDRDVNTVFQDYALFPHLSVAENVEYGLVVAKVPRAERRARVADALEQVRLGDHGRRRPAQLSGGQRQRVALARALVNRPQVLLLDEPLGALDLKLREQMQVELKAIQRDVGITFLFVTHDQEEALTLSDRVAVFNAGRIEQVGTAHEVYESPRTAFVAGFVGTSNLLTGDAARAVVGRSGSFAIRPEKLAVTPEPGPGVGAGPSGGPRYLAGDEREAAGAGSQSAPGALEEVVYGGPVTRYVVRLDAGSRLTALEQNTGRRGPDRQPRRGDRVLLRWHPEHVIDVPTTPEGAHASTGPDPLGSPS